MLIFGTKAGSGSDRFWVLPGKKTKPGTALSLAAQSSNRAVRLMMSAGRLLEHAAAPPWGEGAQGLEVNAAVRWPQYEVSKRLATRQPAL